MVKRCVVFPSQNSYTLSLTVFTPNEEDNQSIYINVYLVHQWDPIIVYMLYKKRKWRYVILDRM